MSEIEVVHPINGPVCLKHRRSQTVFALSLDSPAEVVALIAWLKSTQQAS